MPPSIILTSPDKELFNLAEKTGHKGNGAIHPGWRRQVQGHYLSQETQHTSTSRPGGVQLSAILAEEAKPESGADK